MDALALIVICVFGLGLAWLAIAGTTFWLARRRGGAPGKWAALALLLGPVGLWLVLRLVRPCPACGATVLREVATCPACGAPIPRRDPDQNPAGPLWSYRKDW